MGDNTEGESLKNTENTDRESLKNTENTERESLKNTENTEKESLKNTETTEKESLKNTENTERESLKKTEKESLKNSAAEMKQPSQENVSKITEIKEKLSAEIEKIEENINEISKMKQESIEKIELKKKDLRELSGASEICQDKDETMRELLIYGKDIEERKISITMLDETIASLDKQIAQIQAEHDKAIAELDLKKRKLNAKLEYYDALNKRLQELLEMIQQDSKQHEEKINDLLRQRSELLKRTDLSETTLKDMLSKLDTEIENCNKEHELIMECFERKFSDMDITDTEIMSEFRDELGVEPVQLLTEEQLKEIEEFEDNFYKLLHPRISSQERLALLRRGLQITPSGRIIMGDKIITLNQARLLGLLAEWQEPEEEEIVEPEAVIEEEKEKKKRGFMGILTPSEISTSGVSSSIESELDQRDIEYLKHVFGKSLSLALAEIVAVQPSDPIHYLAHWFIKYRYNQEIDEVKRLEIQALMIEREKIEAERWRRELEEEAYLAVLEALFRAENIIRQQEYERMEMMEMEGEYEEDRFNPMELFNI